MLEDNEWFTEICEESGSAFSVKIKSRIHREQTPYQVIDVYDTEDFGHLMVIDGFVMLSERDHFFYHEMMTHPVLFRHPSPKKVAIIGGGDCGSLHEVLKHPGVEEAWLIEIDERVTRLSEMYFPELCQSNGDSRARFHFDDGIAWVKAAADDSVDVIIVDSTDPIGPAEGLFKAAFYRECLRALGPEGILVQQSESPLFHLKLIRSMRSEMHEAGAARCQTLYFPQCVYPSGWWSATLASRGSLDHFREDDEAQRTFTTRYYNKAMHMASQATAPFIDQAFAAGGQ